MSQEIALAVDEPQQTAADIAYAKNVGDTLVKHYPSHLWLVSVHGGVCDVRNINLSGHWGFRFRVNEIFSATQLDKKLMQAGGEILERFRLSREKMSADRVVDKTLALQTDFAGRTVFDK